MSRPGSVRVIRFGPPVTEVSLEGEIDCSTTAEVDDLITRVREADSLTRINAEALTFIDARGLRSITELGTCTGYQPVVIDPPPIFAFLLDVTDLDRVFTVVSKKPRRSSAGPDGFDQAGGAAADQEDGLLARNALR